MANLQAPPVYSGDGEFVCPPQDVYEAVPVSIEEVPNSFYDPNEDPVSKKTQFQWEFQIVEEGPYKGQKIRYWTGATLSRSPKAKLPKLLSLLDRRYNIDEGYESVDDMIERSLYNPVRIATEVKTVDKLIDGVNTSRDFPKIVSFLPTKVGEKVIPVQKTVDITNDIPF